MRIHTKGNTAESNRQYNREYIRERRANLIEKGLCPACGKNKPMQGKTLCLICLERQRNCQKRYSEKIKAQKIETRLQPD